MKIQQTKKLMEKIIQTTAFTEQISPIVNAITLAFYKYGGLMPDDYKENLSLTRESMQMQKPDYQFTDEEIDRGTIISMLRSLFPESMDGGVLEYVFGEIYKKSRLLTKEEFAENPYYKNIKFERQQQGDIAMLTETYKPYELFFYDTPDFDGKYPAFVPKIGLFNEEFLFQSIGSVSQSKAMMTLSPNEIFTMQKPIENAHGKVLMLGCGLGYFAYMASLKENVESVVIVEINQDVIDLFEQHILPQFETKDKIHIIKADALEFLDTLNDGEYDYCFADIWLGADEFQLYMTVKEKCKRFRKMKTDYWIEDAFVKQLIPNVFIEIQSTFFKEPVPYSTMPEIEQQKMRYIHRLLKNETVSSPQQVENLLNPVTLIRLINKSKVKFSDCAALPETAKEQPEKQNTESKVKSVIEEPKAGDRIRYWLGGVECENAFSTEAEMERISKQENGELESEYKYGLYQREESIALLKEHSVHALAGEIYKGAVIGLKNGNCFVDGGLNVIGKDGIKRNFMTLTIYCSDDMVFDTVNGFVGTDLYEYIEMLKQWNPKLRMDVTMFIGTAWSDKSAALFNWLKIRR